jgi:hypothetical protein
MALPHCLALTLSAALAVVASGCGGSGSGSTAVSTATATVTTPTASVPRGEPPPPPDAAQTGDAQQVRVPATYTVVGGRLQPATITVPPFLAVEISLTAADGHPHRLLVRTPTWHVLAVAAGGHEAVRIPGLRAGRYAVELDGKPAGALLVGGDAGP